MKPIWENDQTRDMAAPAVIVAAIRSGGTFLAHCLSNHPQIFCDRGEPLHFRSVWWEYLHPSRRQLLAVLLNQPGYQVSMCKLTYMQALHLEFWPWLTRHQPRVIWLRRENVIRQSVSVLINKAARDGRIRRAQHTFQTAEPVQVELSPGAILAAARSLRDTDRSVGERLKLMTAVCPVTYEQITGQPTARAVPPEMAARLCAFLGVPYAELHCDLQRVNPFPLREMLSNWPDVTAAVRASEFAELIVDE